MGEYVTRIGKNKDEKITFIFQDEAHWESVKVWGGDKTQPETLNFNIKFKTMAKNLTNTNIRVKKHTHVMADITDLAGKLSQIEQSVTNSAVEVIDNLTSTEAGKALSANQGKALKDAIDGINTLIASNDEDLNTIQEIVDKIKNNKDAFDRLTADNLVGLAAKLAAKQDTASLDTDVANAGFIKQAAVDTAIEGLKSNGKIKDELLSDKVVKYDDQGDITTKQAALTDYEETEVPTSKAVKDAIATAKQEAIAAANGALTQDAVERLMTFRVKEFTLTFNGTTEAEVADAFVTPETYVMTHRFESTPNSHVDFFTEAGKVSATADENENLTVKVMLIKPAV